MFKRGKCDAALLRAESGGEKASAERQSRRRRSCDLPKLEGETGRRLRGNATRADARRTAARAVREDLGTRRKGRKGGHDRFLWMGGEPPPEAPGGGWGYCTRLMVEANTPTAIAETMMPQIDAPIARGMIIA